METSVESFLAKLYTDIEFCKTFLDAPEATARGAGLAEADVAALCRIDRAGLVMAAKSYANKRASHRKQKTKLSNLLAGWLLRQ